jgi:hypothetical protein
MTTQATTHQPGRVTTTVKGVLGEKLGMTQVWDENNKVVPVTVVKAGPCVVTQIRTPETDGYDAVQIAFGAANLRKVTKPMQGHFDKAGVTPRRNIVELRTADAGEYSLGQELGDLLLVVLELGLESLHELDGSAGDPGCAKCQPGARIPTPGSDTTLCPSALTVPVPTTSQAPAE